MSFQFTEPLPCGDDILKAENLSVEFENKTLFSNVDLDIKKGEKIFIVGSNGCGKTTLISSLLHPDKVPVQYTVGVKIGYFDQHQQNLDLSNTAFSELRNSFPQLSDTTLRNSLAVFGFKGDEVFSKIADLSGGERARVSLCKLMLTGANLLILDEPTNHLDIYSVAALETALSLFSGTVLAVSHDRYFINSLADRVLELTPNGIIEHPGGSTEYFASVTIPKAEVKADKPIGAGKEEYLRRKAHKAQLRTLLSTKSTLEKQIAEIENETELLNNSLTDEALATDYEEMTRITIRIAELEENYEALLAKWEANEEELLKANEQ